VFEGVSDKWELLHYDVAVASNPQVDALLKEGSDSSACGQVSNTGSTDVLVHHVVV
jgi:hypothetical protein